VAINRRLPPQRGHARTSMRGEPSHSAPPTMDVATRSAGVGDECVAGDRIGSGSQYNIRRGPCRFTGSVGLPGEACQSWSCRWSLWAPVSRVGSPPAPGAHRSPGPAATPGRSIAWSVSRGYRAQASRGRLEPPSQGVDTTSHPLLNSPPPTRLSRGLTLRPPWGVQIAADGFRAPALVRVSPRRMKIHRYTFADPYIVAELTARYETADTRG